jgi:hypothetical protein
MSPARGASRIAVGWSKTVLSAFAVALVLTGCVQQLPPAETPARRAPAVEVPPASEDGRGLLVLDVVDGPTTVQRVRMEPELATPAPEPEPESESVAATEPAPESEPAPGTEPGPETEPAPGTDPAHGTEPAPKAGPMAVGEREATEPADEPPERDATATAPPDPFASEPQPKPAERGRAEPGAPDPFARAAEPAAVPSEDESLPGADPMASGSEPELVAEEAGPEPEEWWFSRSYEALCEATPCVTEVPRGNVLLAFPVAGDSGRLENELVHVGPEPLVYRRALSHYEPGGALYLSGIMGALVGSMTAIPGLVFLPLGLAEGDDGYTKAGAITLGVGGLLVALSVWAIKADGPTYRPGAATHFPLANGR